MLLELLGGTKLRLLRLGLGDPRLLLGRKLVLLRLLLGLLELMERLKLLKRGNRRGGRRQRGLLEGLRRRGLSQLQTVLGDASLELLHGARLIKTQIAALCLATGKFPRPHIRISHRVGRDQQG